MMERPRLNSIAARAYCSISARFDTQQNGMEKQVQHGSHAYPSITPCHNDPNCLTAASWNTMQSFVSGGRTRRTIRTHPVRKLAIQ